MKYVFGTGNGTISNTESDGSARAIIVNHLRRLADKIENGETNVHEMSDTLRLRHEEFAQNDLTVVYNDPKDQINLRMVSPAYAVMEKLKDCA